MMDFYGNIKNTGDSPFTFDRIYSSRYEMEKSMFDDEVFAGRFVLVSYNTSINNFLFKRAYRKESLDYSKTHEVQLYKDSGFKYPISPKYESVDEEESTFVGDIYYVQEGSLYVYYQCSRIYKNSETKTATAYFSYSYDFNQRYREAFRNSTSISQDLCSLYKDSEYTNPYTSEDLKNNDYVYVRERELEQTEKEKALGMYSFYQCHHFEGENNEAKFQFIQKMEGRYSDGSIENYLTNLKIDYTEYGVNGDVGGYDGTVWQKVYAGERERYVQVANLNAKIPQLNLVPEAPTFTPKAPYFDTHFEQEAVKNLHMQPSWGFRVRAANASLSTSGMTQNIDTGNYMTYQEEVQNTVNTYVNHLFDSEDFYQTGIQNALAGLDSAKREDIKSILNCFGRYTRNLNLTEAELRPAEEAISGETVYIGDYSDSLQENVDNFINNHHHSNETTEDSTFGKQFEFEDNGQTIGPVDLSYYKYYEDYDEYTPELGIPETYYREILGTNSSNEDIYTLIESNLSDVQEYIQGLLNTLINDIFSSYKAENLSAANFNQNCAKSIYETYTKISSITDRIFNRRSQKIYDENNQEIGIREQTLEETNEEQQELLSIFENYESQAILLRQEYLKSDSSYSDEEEFNEDAALFKGTIFEEIMNFFDRKVVLSDQDISWINNDHYYNGSEWTVDSSKFAGDIYYNKAGFNKTINTKDFVTGDSIEVNPTGFSQTLINGNTWVNTSYNNPDSLLYGDTIEKPDTQELSIHLPTIGNTISEVWDIVYGEGEIDETTGLKKRKTLIDWNALPGEKIQDRERMVGLTENRGLFYDTEALGTLAGVINSTQDLIGKIIIQNPEGYVYQSQIPSDFIKNYLDSNRIYYFTADETYYRIAEKYDFKENCYPAEDFHEVETPLFYMIGDTMQEVQNNEEYDPNKDYFTYVYKNSQQVFDADGETPLTTKVLFYNYVDTKAEYEQEVQGYHEAVDPLSIYNINDRERLFDPNNMPTFLYYYDYDKEAFIYERKYNKDANYYIFENEQETENEQGIVPFIPNDQNKSSFDPPSEGNEFRYDGNGNFLKDEKYKWSSQQYVDLTGIIEGPVYVFESNKFYIDKGNRNFTRSSEEPDCISFNPEATYYVVNDNLDNSSSITDEEGHTTVISVGNIAFRKVYGPGSNDPKLLVDADEDGEYNIYLKNEVAKTYPKIEYNLDFASINLEDEDLPGYRKITGIKDRFLDNSYITYLYTELDKTASGGDTFISNQQQYYTVESNEPISFDTAEAFNNRDFTKELYYFEEIANDATFVEGTDYYYYDEENNEYQKINFGSIEDFDARDKNQNLYTKKEVVDPTFTSIAVFDPTAQYADQNYNLVYFENAEAFNNRDLRLKWYLCEENTEDNETTQFYAIKKVYLQELEPITEELLENSDIEEQPSRIISKYVPNTYYYRVATGEASGSYNYYLDTSDYGSADREPYFKLSPRNYKPKVYQPRTIYYKEYEIEETGTKEYILTSEEYSLDSKYYEHNIYYVTKDYDNYEVGQIWDYSLPWFEYLIDSNTYRDKTNYDALLIQLQRGYVDTTDIQNNGRVYYYDKNGQRKVNWAEDFEIKEVESDYYFVEAPNGQMVAAEVGATANDGEKYYIKIQDVPERESEGYADDWLGSDGEYYDIFKREIPQSEYRKVSNLVQHKTVINDVEFNSDYQYATTGNVLVDFDDAEEFHNRSTGNGEEWYYFDEIKITPTSTVVWEHPSFYVIYQSGEGDFNPSEDCSYAHDDYFAGSSGTYTVSSHEDEQYYYFEFIGLRNNQPPVVLKSGYFLYELEKARMGLDYHLCTTEDLEIILQTSKCYVGASEDLYSDYDNLQFIMKETTITPNSSFDNSLQYANENYSLVTFETEDEYKARDVNKKWYIRNSIPDPIATEVTILDEKYNANIQYFDENYELCTFEDEEDFHDRDLTKDLYTLDNDQAIIIDNKNYYFYNITGFELEMSQSNSFNYSKLPPVIKKGNDYYIEHILALWTPGFYYYANDYSESIRQAHLVPKELLEKYKKYYFKELKGFSKNYNTINGLILQFNKMLGQEEESRDLNTVYGSLRRLNDEIRRLRIYDYGAVNNIISGIEYSFNKINLIHQSLQALTDESTEAGRLMLTELEATKNYSNLEDFKTIIGVDLLDGETFRRESHRIKYREIPSGANQEDFFAVYADDDQTNDKPIYYYKKLKDENGKYRLDKIISPGENDQTIYYKESYVNGLEDNGQDFLFEMGPVYEKTSDGDLFGVKNLSPIQAGFDLFNWEDSANRSIIDQIKHIQNRITETRENYVLKETFKNILGLNDNFGIISLEGIDASTIEGQISQIAGKVKGLSTLQEYVGEDNQKYAEFTSKTLSERVDILMDRYKQLEQKISNIPVSGDTVSIVDYGNKITENTLSISANYSTGYLQCTGNIKLTLTPTKNISAPATKIQRHFYTMANFNPQANQVRTIEDNGVKIQVVFDQSGKISFYHLSGILKQKTEYNFAINIGTVVGQAIGWTSKKFRCTIAETSPLYYVLYGQYHPHFGDVMIAKDTVSNTIDSGDHYTVTIGMKDISHLGASNYTVEKWNNMTDFSGWMLVDQNGKAAGFTFKNGSELTANNNAKALYLYNNFSPSTHHFEPLFKRKYKKYNNLEKVIWMPVIKQARNNSNNYAVGWGIQQASVETELDYAVNNWKRAEDGKLAVAFYTIKDSIYPKITFTANYKEDKGKRYFNIKTCKNAGDETKFKNSLLKACVTKATTKYNGDYWILKYINYNI